MLVGVGFGDDVFEVVGDGGEVGGRGGMCGLVSALEGEFGLLGVEVIEARLEARQSLFRNARLRASPVRTLRSSARARARRG